MKIILRELSSKLKSSGVYPDNPVGFQALDTYLNQKFQGLLGWGYAFQDDFLVLDFPFQKIDRLKWLKLKSLSTNASILDSDLKEEAEDERPEG